MRLCQKDRGASLKGLPLVQWTSEVAQSCPALWDPMDYSLPGSSIHGIFQASVLEWVAISFSRGSSAPRDRTQVSRITGRHFTIWATRKALSSQWKFRKRAFQAQEEASAKALRLEADFCIWRKRENIAGKFFMSLNRQRSWSTAGGGGWGVI